MGAQPHHPLYAGKKFEPGAGEALARRRIGQRSKPRQRRADPARADLGRDRIGGGGFGTRDLLDRGDRGLLRRGGKRQGGNQGGAQK